MKDYVMFIEKADVRPDNNLGYTHELVQAWGLASDGEINEIKDTKVIYKAVSILEEMKTGIKWESFFSLSRHFYQTTVSVREDYLDLFNSKRKRGRPAKNVMDLMDKEIKNHGATVL